MEVTNMMKIGLQMISVQDMMAEDPVKAIQAVTAVGYKHLEFANHHARENYGVGFDITAKELRTVMADCGADCIGTHVVPMDMDNLKYIADYHLEAGCTRLTVCGTFYQTSDDLKRCCENLNAMGEYGKEVGLSLSYHNHFQEYFSLNGKRILDTIAAETNPNLVDLQLDTYWVYQGGYDAIEEIRHLGNRIVQLHQKDLPRGTELFYRGMDRLGIDRFNEKALREFSQGFVVTEIGDGVLDIQGIINAANQHTNAQYIILEHDGKKAHSEIDSISMSYQNLARFHGIQTD